MADATQIFDLTARIRADMGDIPQKMRETQKAVIELTEAFGALDKSTEALVTGLSAVAGGFVAAGAAAVGLGSAIFEVSERAAEYGESIYKAQAATGLSANQLSVLKVISAETGTAFESLTMSAARMQVAISRGFTEKAGEAAKALQVLKLNTDAFKNSSPDQQFLQVAKALQETTSQADKNRAALALVSRGFNVSAGALREFAEQYDETYKKADAFGLLLGQEEVDNAHKFDVAIKDLTLVVEGFGVQAGERTMPMVIHAIQDLGAALGVNVGDWKNWGRDAGEILAHVVGVAEVSASLIKNALVAAVQTPIAATKGMLLAPLLAYQTGSLDLAAQALQGTANQPIQSAASNVLGTATHVQANLWSMMANSRFGSAAGGARGGVLGSFGGGGGRSGKGAKEEIDEVTQALAKQSEQIQEAWARTDKYQKTIDDLVRSLEKKHKALTDDQRAQLENNAETLRGIDLMHSWWDFLRSQERSIQDARSGLDQYDKAIRDWEDNERKAGRAVTDGMLAIARQNAEIQRSLALTRQRIALEQTLIERQERERAVTDEARARLLGIDLSDGSETRPRRTTDWMRDRVKPYVDQLTQLISQSIDTGFQQGMKAGLVEFAKGILQMIESKMLEKLADAITDAIVNGIKNSQGGGASGGGGIFGTIAHVLLGAIGGIAGGALGGLTGGINGGHVGGGTIGTQGHALGGILTEPIVGVGLSTGRIHTFAEHGPETVVPGVGGAGGNVHITVYARDAQSFASRETQRQIADRYRRLMVAPALGS